MIYQIVFSVSHPICDNKKTKEEIIKDFFTKLETEIKKEDRFQTHDYCWFINSELTAKDLLNHLNPSNDINIIISQINHNIAGNTWFTYWEWLKEKNKTTEEMSECYNNINCL